MANGNQGQYSTLAYQSSSIEKRPDGGSTFGSLVKIEGDKYIAKSSLIFSLLAQIAGHLQADDKDKVSKKAGFVVGELEKFLGKTFEKEEKKSMQTIIVKAVQDFVSIQENQLTLENLPQLAAAVEGVIGVIGGKEGVITSIHNDQIKNEAISASLLSDLTTVTDTHVLVNSEGGVICVASKFVEKSRPLQEVIAQGVFGIKDIESLKKQGRGEKSSSEDEKQVAIVVNNYFFAENPKILRGMMVSACLRSFLGETSDIGSDNMLLAANGEVVNIDFGRSGVYDFAKTAFSKQGNFSAADASLILDLLSPKAFNNLPCQATEYNDALKKSMLEAFNKLSEKDKNSIIGEIKSKVNTLVSRIRESEDFVKTEDYSSAVKSFKDFKLSELEQKAYQSPSEQKGLSVGRGY